MVDDGQLDGLRSHGLQWIADHRADFDPDASDGSGRRPDKALIELAVFARRLTDRPQRPGELVPITDWLDELLTRPRYQERAQRRRAHVVGAAFLLGATDSDSQAWQSLRQRLQRTVDAGLLEALERPAHRVMEERLALEWASVRHSLPQWEDLVAASLLGTAPNPAFVDETAAYQITHVAMYLTGFGSRPAVCALDDLQGHRRRFATLILRFVIREHWDLVAELLLSWACLGLGHSGVCDAAWQNLLDRVAPDGSLHAVAGETGATPGSKAWFATRYHTTLVAVMAAETWLRPRAGKPPSGRNVAEARRSGATTALAREVATAEVDELAGLLNDGVDHHLRVPCSALVGVWMSGALCPAGEQRLPDLAVSVASALGNDGVWTEVPAALALVTYAILASRDLAPHGLGRYVAMTAGALARSQPEDRSLDEPRWLLHGIGFGAAPSPPAAEALTDAAQQAASYPTSTTIEPLLLTAESRSGYGAAPPGGPAWIIELLIGMAVHRARADDLVVAGRATRAAVHLGGVSGDAALEMAEYIACQQRTAGGFVPTGRARVREDSLADSLAVSLSCLWTLAEATTDWRLATEIRAPRRYPLLGSTVVGTETWM